MTKKRILLTSLLFLSLALFSAKIREVLPRKKPKPSLSLFLHPSTVRFISFFDRLTGQKGCPNIWGDGVFSYGLWDSKLEPEIEKSHFSKKEVDRKVFVSINLKDLLLKEVRKLEKENSRSLSELDYQDFKSLPALQEKLFWLLEDDSHLEGFYEEIRTSCQYASRRDVFIFHGEYLLDPDLYKEAQMEVEVLSKFLKLPF